MAFSIRHFQHLYPSFIFVFFAFLIIIFTVGVSNRANFNKVVGLDYKFEYAYSMQDIRELLANHCKFPFIFFANYDVEDGVYEIDPEDDCEPNDLNKYVNLSSKGVLTLRSKQETNSSSKPIRCTYYKHSGVSERYFEILPDVPVQVPFYDFALSCKRDGIVEFVKPFINFAVIPKEVPGESVAIILLPSMHHLLFMKKMSRSKNFMLKNKFKFAHMMNMKEPTPFLDLLLQLGISSDTSVFQKAKKQNFTTFFSGPQQIRDLIDVDYDTTDHRNFISDYLIDENLCLEDGRKLMDDQLEKMELFMETTNGSKFFSVMFLDDYGSQRSLIDYDFSELLTRLNQKGIFESTTLIITSYDLSINEMTDENSRNPLFAVRLSDNLMKSQPTEFYFLHLNFYRNCMSEGIPEDMCLCMKPINEPNFPQPSKQNFPENLRKEFAEEIQKYKCVQSFEIKNSTEFFEYDSERGKIIALELSAQATIISKNKTKMDLSLTKTFVYDALLNTFREFDYARIHRDHEVNIIIVSICVL